MIRNDAASMVVALAATLLCSASSLAEGVDIGDQAPAIQGTSTHGKQVSLEDVQKNAKAVVVAFTCNGCPVAQAYEERFIEFTKEYQEKGVAFLAVNVNPESLDAMKQRAEEEQFNFPYIKDESGDSARQYGAKVTPHLFVVDSQGKVAYIGSFDDDIRNPQEKLLEEAVDAVLAGKTPKQAKTKAFGCGIKI